TIESEIFQADVVQERQTFVNFLQQLVGDARLLWGEAQLRKEAESLFHRHAANFADVLATDPDLACLRTQPGAATGRTQRISAVAAQKYTNVQLVFLTFEMGEEAADAGVASLALDDCLSLLGIEFLPGNIQRNIALLGEA